MHYKFIMKRSFCILIAFIVTSVGVMADIQAPPASTYTPTRKLGRALSNIFLSMEVSEQMVRKTEQYGSECWLDLWCSRRLSSCISTFWLWMV